jgi:hypothetical protein
VYLVQSGIVSGTSDHCNPIGEGNNGCKYVSIVYLIILEYIP